LDDYFADPGWALAMRAPEKVGMWRGGATVSMPSWRLVWWLPGLVD